MLSATFQQGNETFAFNFDLYVTLQDYYLRQKAVTHFDPIAKLFYNLLQYMLEEVFPPHTLKLPD